MLVKSLTKNKLRLSLTDFPRGEADICIRYATGDCSLGAVLVAATDKGVCAIMLGEEPKSLFQHLQERFANTDFFGPDLELDDPMAKVVAFVEMPARGLDVTLDIRGTVFQQRVWRALCKIPSGSTASYSEIAEQIGAPRSVRAVAQACGANPVALAVPCHRVVGKNGEIGGYRWGEDRKRMLLDREKWS